MSRYRFELEDYHAVRKADIDIDGITVLAGPNGCGKSTVARWLNFCVATLTEYHQIVHERMMMQLRNFVYPLERALRSVRGGDSNEKFDIHSKIQEIYSIESEEEMLSTVRQIMSLVVAFIHDNLKNEGNGLEMERLLGFFEMEVVSGESVDGFAERLWSILSHRLDEIVAENRERYLNQTDVHFSEALKTMVDPMVDDYHIELSMDFYEDGSNLLGNVFNVPLMLDRSIYLNTQSLGRALDGDESRIAEMLESEDSVVPESVRRVASMVKLIINGDVGEEKNELPYNRAKRLQYIRRDGMRIYLKGAATGIISFSYILRLLENGWITEGTLLIIDEPEAHLHPQWIVDYARMLVLICREIGAKVVVSSHNPDMVAAIQSVSRKEGVLDKVHFYIAEEIEDGSGRYDYRDLGQEVDAIFDSFNIALDRIALYGSDC